MREAIRDLCRRTEPGRGLIPVYVLLAACGGDNGLDSATYTARDSAGIRIIESVSPAWADSARIEPEPLLRMGREGEGPYQFSRPNHGLLLAGGGIVVAEGGAQDIRLFDSAGHHVRTIGRRGEGPGEFRSITGLFEIPGDSIAVSDQRLRRTTIIDRGTGSYRVVTHRVEGNYDVFGVIPGGPVLLYSPGSGFRPDLEPGLQWVASDVYAMDPGGGTGRVIATLPSREQRVEPDGNARMPIPPRWSIRAVTGDGFYWATSDRYEVGFYDADGVKRRSIRRAVEPKPVEPALVERYIEANLEVFRRLEGEASLPRHRRGLEQAHYGEHVPLFQSAFADRDGRLWIAEPVWPELGGAPRRWTVFSPDGVWLGDLAAPDRLDILDARGDLVLGVWRDDLDVPYVQVHRLVGGGDEATTR